MSTTQTDREAFSKVFGMYVDRGEQLHSYRKNAERAILVYRRRLREIDPDLPFELAGNAWAPIEAAWEAEQQKETP